VIATLARKQKAGEIALPLLEQKVLELEEDWGRFIQVHLTTEVVDIAKELARGLALRGADAIHLASAE
jgi:predicted nucleic acid-binding protein